MIVVSVTLDEATARWARLEAARRDTSVSRFVGDMLRTHMEEASRYRGAMEEFLARKPRRLRDPGDRLPGRADVHER